MAREIVRPSDLDEMAGCVCTSLRQATRAVTQFYDAALRPHRLRVTQLPILVATSRHGGMPLALLAQKLGMDRTTLLRNVRPLVRRKLVAVATERGSRRVEVRATPSGKALLARLHPAWRAAQAAVLDALGGADWGRTLAALRSVAGKARN